MTYLTQLIADLEKAEGPSRAMDFAIAKTVWSGVLPETTKHDPPIHFTSSLDAALTLVPEGYRSELQQSWDGTWWDAYVSLIDLDGMSPFETGQGVVNPALALCIAALKARAAIALAEVAP